MSLRARGSRRERDARPAGLGQVRVEPDSRPRTPRARAPGLPATSWRRPRSVAESARSRQPADLDLLRVLEDLVRPSRRASAASPSSCAASQPNHWPRICLRKAVSVRLARGHEHLRRDAERRPARGRNGAALREPRAPKGASSAARSAGFLSRASPRGGGTGPFGRAPAASRVKTSWSSPRMPSRASVSSKESFPRVFSRSATSASTIWRAPATLGCGAPRGVRACPRGRGRPGLREHVEEREKGAGLVGGAASAGPGGGGRRRAFGRRRAARAPPARPARRRGPRRPT